MFHGCTNLVNVELSEKVTSIGNSAFYNCKGLEIIAGYRIDNFYRDECILRLYKSYFGKSFR